MKQTFFTLTITVVIILMLVAVVVGSYQEQKTGSEEAKKAEQAPLVTTDPILYYGNTCPHCQELELWLEDKQIEEKVKIIKKEVYENSSNALELSRAAKSCGLDPDRVGVPFLYTPESKCLIGTPDITKYFSAKAGLDTEVQATESAQTKGL